MATFVSGDAGKTKELKIAATGAIIKARIDSVNVGGSQVSYTPLKRTPEPQEMVGSPVSNAAWSTIDTQADWPSLPPLGRGRPMPGYPGGRQTFS